MGPLWEFLSIISSFHVSEFSLAYIYTRNDLSVASCLITWPYLLAMGAGLVEYAVEEAYFPRWKAQGSTFPGWVLVCAGEGLRKYAMVTAKDSFTHQIQQEGHPTNRLVTWGPYRYIRHPGYLGWFVWAIGTQVLLRNPVCILVFGCVIWSFFRARIRVEEGHLRKQFGDRYIEYCRRVPTYLPFIS